MPVLSYSATSHLINLGKPIALANLTRFTAMCWCYPTASDDIDGILYGRLDATYSGFKFLFANGLSRRFGVEMGRPTTDFRLRSTTNVYNRSEWTFFAATIDPTLAATDNRLYVGSLTIPLAEVASYQLQQVGSGAFVDDSGIDSSLGNTTAGTEQPFFDYEGYQSWIGIWPEVLPYAEIARQFRQPTFVRNPVLFMYPGREGTNGIQQDLSAYRNNGTITGASVVNDAPPYRIAQRIYLAPYRAAVSTDLTINASDSITVSETVTRLLQSHVSVTDGITVTESVGVALAHQVSVSDSAAVAESVAVALAHQVSVSDSATVSETVTARLESYISAAEAITVAETVTVRLESAVSVADSATVTESVTVALAHQISVTDSATVAESVSLTLVHLVSVTESITTAEAVTMLQTSFVDESEAISVSEAVTVAIVAANEFAVSVNESITVAETVTLLLTNHISTSDGITVSEQVTLLLQSHASVTDSATITETVGVALAHQISVTEALTVAEQVTLEQLSFINAGEAITVGEAVTLLIPQMFVGVNEAITVGELVSVIIAGTIVSREVTFRGMYRGMFKKMR